MCVEGGGEIEGERGERMNVSAPRRCFELSEMHVLS